jgi:sugar transferase EpsL
VRDFLKRAEDFVLSAVVLAVASPVLLTIAAAIRATARSPVLFRHVRPGKDGRPFTLLKFRTMREAAHAGEPDAHRLTGLGWFLRSTSLDELPELVNVLRGEMSLVGPRPLLVRYLERYTPEQRRRHEVKPGITGWAQINGRNAVTWERKFELDVWYVDNRSFLLDQRILVTTLLKVLRREGITEPGQATAREFMGTRQQSHEEPTRQG